MDFFLSQVLILLPVLGFSFALTIPTPNFLNKEDDKQAIQNISPLFYLNFKDEVRAKAQEINSEFVVFKDSLARQDEVDSCPSTAKILRQEFIKDGKLVNNVNSSTLRFTENVSFSSPSTAASVICGSSRNGRDMWKVEGTDQTYNAWQQTQIDKASTV